MRPLMSCSVAKEALPITRLRSMRPAIANGPGFSPSSCSLDLSAFAACRSAARCVRRKSFGNACPPSRRRASFARRSAMIWFSSCGGSPPALLVLSLMLLGRHLSTREIHDHPHRQVQARLDRLDEDVFVVVGVCAEAAQAEALDHRPRGPE